MSARGARPAVSSGGRTSGLWGPPGRRVAVRVPGAAALGKKGWPFERSSGPTEKQALSYRGSLKERKKKKSENVSRERRSHGK